MTNAGLDPKLIASSIEAARARKAQALKEYEAASAELDWWLKGAELVGLAVVREDDEPGSADVEELFPDAGYFEQSETTPTLRQGIMAFLREYPSSPFAVADIAAALVNRGWLAPDDAHKRVSDLAGVMHTRDQLQRVDRGVYRLHPRFAVAFDRTPAISEAEQVARREALR